MTTPISTFKQLSDVFTVSLEGKFIKINAEKSLEVSKIRPQDKPHHIFSAARVHLSRKEILLGSTIDQLNKQYADITSLEKQSRKFFQGYCDKNQRNWKRRLLKILQQWLPCLFGKTIDHAEKLTSEEYNQYDLCLQDFKELIGKQKKILEQKQISDENTRSLKGNVTESRKTESTGSVDRSISSSSAAPLKGSSYKEMPIRESSTTRVDPVKNLSNKMIAQIRERIEEFDTIAQIKDPTELLNTAKSRQMTVIKFADLISAIQVDLEYLNRFCAHEEPQVLRATLEKEIPLIKLITPNLVKLAQKRDYRAIYTELTHSNWQAPFKAIAASHQQIEVSVQVESDKESSFVCKKVNGLQIVESSADDFTGVLAVREEFLKDIPAFLEKHPTCRPSLQIHFSKNELSVEDIRIINELSKKCSSFTLMGINNIRCDHPTLSPDERNVFLNILLRQSTCQSLSDLTIPKDCLTQLTPKDLEKLLDICPTSFFLEQCLQHPDITSVRFPLRLQCLTHPLFTQTTDPSLIAYVLKQLALIKSLSILSPTDNSSIHDTDIQMWVNRGWLNHINELNLPSCCGLTTDSLCSLARLPQLRLLDVNENIPLGKIAVTEMPKFDNPFKVAEFYSKVKVMCPYVRQLYDGNILWAYIFQIPAARNIPNLPNLFSNKDYLMCPISVASWLDDNRFKDLAPQPHVTHIIADAVDKLNDDNLIPFAEKFPKLKVLSLKLCENITDKGIKALLERFGDQVSINITGCPNVSSILPKRFPLFCEPYDAIITDKDLGPNCENLEKILSTGQYSSVSHFDFTGCQNLTNEALKKFFAHIQLPPFIPHPHLPHQMIRNPQHINPTSINLSKCPHITREAFIRRDQHGEHPLLDLGKIEQVGIGDGDASLNKQEMNDLYIFTGVTFQSTCHYTCVPETDLVMYLNRCLNFSKDFPLLSFPDKTTYMHYFASLYLGMEQLPIDDRRKAKAILSSLTVNPSKDLNNMRMVWFSQQPKWKWEYKVNQQLFRFMFPHIFEDSNSYRFEKEGIAINTNMAPELIPSVMNFIFGKDLPPSLPWHSIFTVVEFLQNSLQIMPIAYESLLDSTLEQFKLSHAFPMLQAAINLGNLRIFRKYEMRLLEILRNDSRLASKMMELTRPFSAKSPFSLKRLQETCNEILAAQVAQEEMERLNLALINDLLKEDYKEDCE